MKYTLNETSFQPSLSANIRIPDIWKKGKSLATIFFARQRAQAEKPRESLIRSRPRYAALERREKEGRLSSTAANEYPFSNTAEVHQFFFPSFSLSLSLDHLMVMCATIGRIYSSWKKSSSSFLFSTMKLKVCWRDFVHGRGINWWNVGYLWYFWYLIVILLLLWIQSNN